MDTFELDNKTRNAAITSAYNMMRETPQTLGEFINETLENYMCKRSLENELGAV